MLLQISNNQTSTICISFQLWFAQKVGGREGSVEGSPETRPEAGHHLPSARHRTGILPPQLHRIHRVPKRAVRLTTVPAGYTLFVSV
jgi:hypothetical protein